MSNPIRPSTQKAIVEAAFTLFSRNQSASLADVAELAGVGRATLHRHFSSREDLTRELSHIAIKETDEAIEAACADLPSYTEALRVTLEVLIPLGDRYGFLALVPADPEPELKSEFSRLREETENLINEAKQEGSFDTSVPTSWIAEAYDALLFAGWESVKADETTASQAASLAWRTLTSGLGKSS